MRGFDNVTFSKVSRNDWRVKERQARDYWEWSAEGYANARWRRCTTFLQVAIWGRYGKVRMKEEEAVRNANEKKPREQE